MQPDARAAIRRDGEGMDLTEYDARAVAKRLVAEHLDTADWLLWEDVPELGEHAFERLSDAVNAEVRSILQASLEHDRATGIDSQWLLGLIR